MGDRSAGTRALLAGSLLALSEKEAPPSVGDWLRECEGLEEGSELELPSV